MCELQRPIEAYLSFCLLERGNTEKWRTWKAQTLADFQTYAAAHDLTRLEELHPWHLTAWLGTCAARAEGVHTLNRRATVVRAWAKWAEKSGMSGPCPMARAEIKQPKPTIRSLPDFRLLTRNTAKLNPEMEAAARLLQLTGARRNEILFCEWLEIAWLLGVLHLPGRRTKSGKPRAVPLPDEALAVLRERRKANASGRGPFLDARGRCLFDPSSLTKAWRREADKAGLYHVRIHDLRHAFCSRSLELGADIATVQTVVGHQSITTTRLYCHPNAEHAKSLKRLWDENPEGAEKVKAAM